MKTEWLLCPVCQSKTRTVVREDNAAVSLWCANEEQAFESIEELFGNAVIDGRRLIEIWDEITLDTLF